MEPRAPLRRGPFGTAPLVNADITRIGVVVPAHDEEALLPGCLDALKVAAAVAPVPVRILVVLDDCTDGSGAVCAHYGVETRRITRRNVGEARATGIRALLEDESIPESVWLASTDADSRVEPSWLRNQIELARSGVDVVLGVVRLPDEGPTPELRRAFDTDYEKLLGDDGSHGHVHGANLGLRASAYLRAGGFLPMANHEDRRLVQQLGRIDGVVIERSQRVGVQTSGRLEARCQEGFAATLRRLAVPILS